MNTTTFFALFQGDYADREEGATCLAVFSTEKKAIKVKETLSKAHTELKRVANDQRNRRLLNGEEAVGHVPDLYWDVQPIPFDPRSVDEL